MPQVVGFMQLGSPLYWGVPLCVFHESATGQHHEVGSPPSAWGTQFFHCLPSTVYPPPSALNFSPEFVVLILVRWGGFEGLGGVHPKWGVFCPHLGVEGFSYRWSTKKPPRGGGDYFPPMVISPPVKDNQPWKVFGGVLAPTLFGFFGGVGPTMTRKVKLGKDFCRYLCPLSCTGHRTLRTGYGAERCYIYQGYCDNHS